MQLPESAAAFLAMNVERLRKIRPKRRIVFPEGDDPRVQAAAERLQREDLVTPMLLGTRGAIAEQDARKYARLYFERRRAKGVTEMEAGEIRSEPAVYRGPDGGGRRCGRVRGRRREHDGRNSARGAALHWPGASVRTVSSAFIVAVPDQAFGHNGLLAFADCSIVIDPSPVELAEIAIATAATTRNIILHAEPIVALLSFSTKGSARHEWVDKVMEALRIVRERAPDLVVDGELQGRCRAGGSGRPVESAWIQRWPAAPTR